MGGQINGRVDRVGRIDGRVAELAAKWTAKLAAELMAAAAVMLLPVLPQMVPVRRLRRHLGPRWRRLCYEAGCSGRREETYKDRRPMRGEGIGVKKTKLLLSECARLYAWGAPCA